MATLEEAERIVKEVTGYYGYLDHDMMDDIGRFNSDYRRRIDENWLKMENAASHSIKVLAKNIYGSGARFVFELLQNAEDNSFRKADDKNEPPFISFQIHPKHIVVECNEDGFTSLDLKAICSVGESTKTAKHGYVGAKGIGFKSVFIAASRVHIQSGNFSFEFRHNRNDPGLGMVRPIWVRPTETFPSPLTRTTLYLHDQGDEDEIEHLKTVIAMQFDDLQETCLLFLRKLSKISVVFYDEEGNLQRSKQFTKKKVDVYRVSLETTVVSGDESATTSQMYHITKQLATGLAQSESRDSATAEEARKSLTSAEVVLAFPLQSDYQPHISTRRQELFAFLPFRTSDYKFSDKIALLDFDLEDIHRLKPLFSWLKIQERYLSKCVVELTAILGDSRVPIPLQKRDLGLKAYQICCGRYEARLSTASKHIDEPAGNLTIYVPQDRRAQEVCFGSVLPRKFAAWLMRNPHTNIDGNVEVDIINALTSIFASDRAVLGEIIDDQGMIQLQFEDLDEDLNEEEIGGEQVEDNHASDSTPEPGYEVSDPVLTPTHSSVDDASILPSAVRGFEIEDGALETEGEIVEIQSSTSHQVRRGDGSTSRFQSTSQQERDKKIGAAGELYVFELLSKLELRGCGRGNWQSTIRTYANIHPEYADLSRWPNRETADLVYSDTQGDLTRILVDAEILSGDWSARLPKYYIQVKTTTGPCGTPFYMSGNQYRLMERIHHSSDFAEVYIIFRVYFLLDREQINYCVYPDPKRLQDDEKLIFTGTTWSVSPGLQV
ncbi:hypothetical protein FOXYS1_858 [Fusarium oxysporum]|uniref:Protein NO VEIN C-terminal domain-containing protein n=1 Tax=Fusarium oxysporum TaxID=5507 RepID=A0A8H5ANZ0_FUSOX|nr:hypothetical protein FOXYS1_858 [Fusarium oxysporum]